MSVERDLYGIGKDFVYGLRLGLAPRRAKARKIGKTSVKYKGRTYKRYKAGYSPWDREEQKKTGDKRAFLCECGADYGQYHVLGCDLEQCPICKEQLLSCGHGRLFETSTARRG